MPNSANWIEVLRTGNLSPDKEMDTVSKWLIITRACVFVMTILSGLLGGMLAIIDGYFSLANLLYHHLNGDFYLSILHSSSPPTLWMRRLSPPGTLCDS